MGKKKMSQPEIEVEDSEENEYNQYNPSNSEDNNEDNEDNNEINTLIVDELSGNERIKAFYDSNKNFGGKWKNTIAQGYSIVKWIYLSYYSNGCFYFFPLDIIRLISSFVIRFKVNHSLIKVLACSGIYSESWKMEYTLNKNDGEAWFTPSGIKVGWIIYDLSDHFLFNKFALK